ncbi:hypothetical protein SAMN05192558_103202 [Actinokineospora alba]|uniref:Uncharacterized protein n=1 Tax=Actinokineospora alba TaxID=504798 RepID=A0A1H0JTL4_9PSEU|nr:hypothetical protein C8E96_3740 [Actinokineospora alba]SDH93676.1 hypothetical protein SAMN05421871_102847 [Actinokineospora alba]SDO46812.1 hypothetical protein SAMN05192558_103202 [Actinokineospora alba]
MTLLLVTVVAMAAYVFLARLAYIFVTRLREVHR